MTHCSAHSTTVMIQRSEYKSEYNATTGLETMMYVYNNFNYIIIQTFSD